MLQDANGRRLVEYQDPDALVPGGFQLTAGREHYGSFRVPMLNSKCAQPSGAHGSFIPWTRVTQPLVCFAAEGLAYTADRKVQQQALWKTSVTTTYAVVMVKACRDAYVTLASSPGVTTHNAYEVQLGVQNNEFTNIAKRGADSFVEQVRDPCVQRRNSMCVPIKRHPF